MHPILFKIPIPEFLQGFLPPEITIFTYGAMIFFGAINSLYFKLFFYYAVTGRTF